MARFYETTDERGNPIFIQINEAAPTAKAPIDPAGSLTKVSPATQATVDAKGTIVARFARLNVIDFDGDVTVSGAVGHGQDVIVSAYQHSSWQKLGTMGLPVGRGRVTEEGDWLMLRGQLFMDTFGGSETYRTLRGLGPLAQYSYGFNIPDGGATQGTFEGERVRLLSKLLVHEVSPVLRGAGVDTGTVELSSVDPTQLMLQRAELENERAMLALQGYKLAPRTVIGYHPTTGAPIRLSSGSGGVK